MLGRMRAVTIGWYRQQIRIRLLHFGQILRRLHYISQALVVKLVGRGSRRAPSENRAQRDSIVLLGHVLMNGVIGKASQCGAAAVEKTLKLVGCREFPQPGEDGRSLIVSQHLALSTWHSAAQYGKG